MVNAPEYRWKKMIGPRDHRPPYTRHLVSVLQQRLGHTRLPGLLRGGGLLGIPAFNMDETPQDMADFIEYVNGPADSQWGRRRAADGHPAPYRLRYIELGNEEAVDEAYWQRSSRWPKPYGPRTRSIILVVGDFAYDQPHRRSLPLHRRAAASQTLGGA